MSGHAATPNALTQQDAAALIGLVAVIEGELLARDLDAQIVENIRRRMEADGLVGAGSGPAQARLALADLGQRLRYVLGEYDEPLEPQTGATEQYFDFATAGSCQSFLDAVRAGGAIAHGPERPHGRRHLGPELWRAAVRIDELVLTEEFDQHVRQLQAVAGQSGGAYGGWGGL